jgi:site-specific recombinase XerD
MKPAEATRLLERVVTVQNHANLRHVQEILGHASLTTTERYLQLTIADLKDAHTRFHPREQEPPEPPEAPAAK